LSRKARKAPKRGPKPPGTGRQVTQRQTALWKVFRAWQTPWGQGLELGGNILKSLNSHKQELLEELKAAEWLESQTDIEIISGLNG
jgi:hypothetical protein